MNKTVVFKSILWLCLGIIFILPVFLIIMNAFKPNNDILTSFISFPKSLYLENFSEAMRIMNFWTVFRNTLFVTVCTVIVASAVSFMSAYGIDLTTCDMHWHMFLALFRCLPENTKIKQIISMRSYRKDNTSYDTQCRKLKTAWALPQEIDAVDSEIVDGINEEFYNC